MTLLSQRQRQLMDKQLKRKIETEIISKMDSIYIENKRIHMMVIKTLISIKGNYYHNNKYIDYEI